MDSLSKLQIINSEQLNRLEKVNKPEINLSRDNKQEQECEEIHISETVNSSVPDRTLEEKITRYKKMIIELKDEKHKIEAKGQNSVEIDRKIEKLETLILNLSK